MSPLPDISEALFDLGDEVELILISKGVVDFEVSEVSKDPIEFTGVLQPLTPTEVLMRPENQRNWKLWHLWSEEDLPFDSLIQDLEGNKFRVLMRQDWRSYLEYDLKEAPTS